MLYSGCCSAVPRSFALCFALLFCLAVSGTPAAAQSLSDDTVHLVPRARPAEVPPERDLEPARLRVDVDLVLVPVTITDVKNQPVLGLHKHDFELYEGDQKQQIRYFSTDDAPISIGILLDLSRSMGNKIDAAREALAEFFRTANPEDDYFVITFADRPQLVANTTTSIGTIQAKVGSVTPAGHTALLDAIYLGVAKLRTARYRRRALLIISDGGDNHSRYRANEIKSLVEEADVQIYALGLFDHIFRTPEEWAGKRLLTDITQATGGRTITLDNMAKLPQAAATISLELRSQYVLGYLPSNAARDGKWRKLKVRLTPLAGPAPLQVYCKRGYMGPGK